MHPHNQLNNNRRGFLKSAGLLSLSVSLPGLIDKRFKIDDDPIIEIHTGNKVTVLVNVFTLQPENEQKLVELLEEGTSSIFSKQPGFISESIHRTSDAKRLVLYGQWEGRQYIEAFRTKPEVGQYFKKIAELATVETVVCNDVAFVHHK